MNLKITTGQAFGIAFICLKMCGVLDWSWGWILFPVILSLIFETADVRPYAITLTVLKLCGVATLSWSWILVIGLFGIATVLMNDIIKENLQNTNENLFEEDEE